MSDRNTTSERTDRDVRRDSRPPVSLCVGLAILTLGLLLTFVVPVLVTTYEVAYLDGVTVRDIVIFASAIIGVTGSYHLYRQRQQDEQRRLRLAIFAELALIGDKLYDEIRDMAVTEVIDDVEPYVPDEIPIVVTVYENNAGELGRLTGDEIEHLTSFYTLAAVLHPRLEAVIQQTDVDPIDVPILRGRMTELYNRRNAAIRELQANLDDVPVEVEHLEDIEKRDKLEELADSLNVELQGTG